MKRLATTLILALALAATVLAADKQPVSDNFINDSVREKLNGDILVKDSTIEVEVKDGVVTLTGHVQELIQKSKAESLAKKVKGVKRVVNDLEIVPR